MEEALTAIFPAYFPDVLTFRRIARSSTLLILDDRPARSSGKWLRAAIKTAEGKRYLSLPTHSPAGKPATFRNLQIDLTKNWQKKHRHSLWASYKNAPFFEHYWPRIEPLFERADSHYIRFFEKILLLLFDILGWGPRFYFSSALSLSGSREAQILRLLQEKGLSTYLIGEERPLQKPQRRGNLQSSNLTNEEKMSLREAQRRSNLTLAAPVTEKKRVSFFDCEVLRSHGFSCQIVRLPARPYPQQFGAFLPNLSILDLLFNLGPETLSYLKEE